MLNIAPKMGRCLNTENFHSKMSKSLPHAINTSREQDQNINTSFILDAMQF